MTGGGRCEKGLCDNNQPYVVVMIREGPSYCSHFATNTTTIHYFPSVPHPMEESPLPIYIEEGTEVPIGECSWDGLFLRGGISYLGFIFLTCVYPFVNEHSKACCKCFFFVCLFAFFFLILIS